MIPYNPPIADMSFLLNDLGMLRQVASLPGYEEADAELVDALLNEAGKLSSEVLAPLNKSGDNQGARFENGVVRTADARFCGEGPVAEDVEALPRGRRGGRAGVHDSQPAPVACSPLDVD